MKNQIMAMIGCVLMFGLTAGARTFDFKQLKTTGSAVNSDYWWMGAEKSKSAWFQVKIGGASKIDDTSEMEIRAATVLKGVRDKKTGINDIATFEFDPINRGKAIYFMVSSSAASSLEGGYYRADSGWQLAGCIIEIWQKGKVVKHWSNVTGKDGKLKLTDDIEKLRINRDGYPSAGGRLRCSRDFDNATEIYSVDQKGERVEIEDVLKPYRDGAADAKDGKDSPAAAPIKNTVAPKLRKCEFLLNKKFKKNAKFYLCLFSASWCPPCRAEMPRIAKTYAEVLKDDPDIELIHFSRDQNDEKAQAWAKEHDVKFPVLKPNGGNPLDLHCNGIPHLFIVKADGTLVEEGHPMNIFNEAKIRELKGKLSAGGAAPQVCIVDEPSGKDDQSVGGSVVAQKLRQCEFLLNEKFKKKAKYYLCLFSASWCPPCRGEMPRIAKTYAETLKDDPDIELIHFSRDQDDEKAMTWAKEHDVKFPVVKPNGGNPLNLQTRGIPHLFIVKADGTLLEEGHPMRIFNEEKFREIRGGSNALAVKKAANTSMNATAAGEAKALDVKWTYELFNGAIRLGVGCSGNALKSPSDVFGELVIPSEIEGVPVRYIGANAFHSRSITSVTIPSSIREIDYSAFLWCKRLKSVTISSGLTPFRRGSPFGYCQELKSFYVDPDNPSFCSRDGLLCSKDGLTLVAGVNGNVSIPLGVTRIGDEAFLGCLALKSVNIPSSVTDIGRAAFLSCRALKAVVVPYSVSNIGEGAFRWCSELTNIEIESGNVSYSSENGVLYNKAKTEVLCWPMGRSGTGTMPSSVTSIGARAFSRCEGLTSITIPKNVKRIGDGAFENCKALTTVVLHGECPDSPDNIFNGCKNLDSIHVSANGKSWMGMKHWKGIPLVFDAEAK